MKRSLRRGVVLAALVALGAVGLDGQGVVRLAADSPLVTDGTALFAVAEDGRTLVTRPLAGASAWVPVALTPAPRSIGGLAAEPEALFLADSAGATLYRLALAGGRPSGVLTVLHQGAPLRHPGELALARVLVVADDETRDVYGLPPGGGSLTRIPRLSQLSPEPVHLAGSENPSEGHLLVSVQGGATPGVLEARLAGPELIILRSLHQVEAGAAGRSPQQPGAVALRAGIVYLTDQADGALYAFPREGGRAVRIVRAGRTGEHQGRTARVVVTTSELLELDAGSRKVVTRPRLVPAELVLQTASLSETLALWYNYLHGQGLLPTREVPHSRNVETTLRAHEALLAPYVRRLDALMCALNRAHCPRGVLRPFQDGEPLRIPDLPFERFARVQPISLDGKATLGQRVDELVPSDSLAKWRSEETLRTLNPKDATAQAANPMAQVAAGSLRSRRTGSYLVPVEAIRYLAAVRAVDIPPGESALGRITRFRGTSVRSLEERRASASAAMQPPPPGTAPQVEDLRAAFEAVTTGWSEDLWLPAPVLIRPHVAVVEEFINRDNPVFVRQEDDAFALDRAGMPQPASVTPAAAAGLVVRAADKADHGTGVAWLIAGRTSAFGAGGLAPGALLFHLPNALDDLIRKLPEAVAQHNVHVVNISAYWRDNIPSDGLSRAINNFSDSALFVVAAGNNLTTGPDGEVCGAFLAFPACWGERRNVLVVTATNRERTGLLAPVADTAGVVTEPGANWSATAVHVAAPGEGYFVPGANGDYVPARGSSFATPLVTATAALLYAQGIQRPSLIKQRILATADPVAGLAGRVKAGVLNVRRALSHPFVSVVTNPDGEKLPLVVVPGQEIEVGTSTGQRRTLPLDSVRRLHKHGTAGSWRIVYATGPTLDKLEIEEDVDFPSEEASGFRYFELKQVVGPGAEPQRYWVSQADRTREGKLVDYVDFVGPAIPPGR